MTRCKCSKSDVKMNEHNSLYFDDITTRMEERRCDLMGKQKYLRDKITTMERSIPALMAYNMWMAGQECKDAPYCKIRELMEKFSPHPDPVDKLLEKLKRTVKELNGETADLHEKIINADVQLEETGMELESLELANNEMNETLNDLEKKVRSYSTPSLHSIQSEDLVCLSKIRELAKEELSLKNRIDELEKREGIFREHLDRLLATKDCRKVCGRRIIRCNQECTVEVHKQSAQRSKKKVGRKENDATQSDPVNPVMTSEQSIQSQQYQKVGNGNPPESVEKKSSWIPNWWKGSQNSTETSSETKTTENQTPIIPKNDSKENTSSAKDSAEKKMPTAPPTKFRKKEFTTSSCKPCGHSTCPPASPTKTAQRPRSRCVASNLRTPTTIKSCGGKCIPTCNIPCTRLFNAFPKPKMGRSRNPFCDLPPCATRDRAPCDLGSLCEIYPSTPCKECLPARAIGNCRCSCRGKCARGLSDAPCNCSDEPLDPLDKGYQPTGKKNLNHLHTEDSNSEDDFCECCSCGCEDSDASLSCNCN